MKNGQKFLMIFGLALLISFVAYDAVVPRVVRAQSSVATEIRAQRFVLVNADGEVGAIISADNGGAGEIRLYWKGREMFHAGGPIVHPLAQSSPAQLSAATEIRTQRFVLVNDKGEVGAIIGFEESGAGTIRLYSKGQEAFPGGLKRQPLAPSDPAQEVRAQRFTVTNEKGVPVGIIGFDKQGSGALALYDNLHQEIYRAGVAAAVPLLSWQTPDGLR